MVPRRPHTGTIFGGTRIKPRSVWISTSGAWGQPSAVHADRTPTKSALLDAAHEAQPSSPMPPAIAHAVFPPTPPRPRPASPTRWLQQSLARSAEARQQVGDTAGAVVSSQCTVAEHRTLLLPALIHLCSLPPNCRVLASTAPTTLKVSKNKFGVFTGITAKTVQKAETHNVFCPISAKQKNPFLDPSYLSGTKGRHDPHALLDTLEGSPTRDD